MVLASQATSCATQLGLAPASILVRLDGLYGDAAPLLDVLSANLTVIVRSRAYHLLDLDVVKRRLVHAPDHVSTHAESGMTRSLKEQEPDAPKSAHRVRC